MSTMKTLMESIDDIYQSEPEAETPELTAPELLKEIVGSLKELSSQVASGEIEDISTVTADLKTISDSLKELLSVDEQPEEQLEEDTVEDYAPTIDSDGVQNYETSGDSYPQNKGFVGI